MKCIKLSVVLFLLITLVACEGENPIEEVEVSGDQTSVVVEKTEEVAIEEVEEKEPTTDEEDEVIEEEIEETNILIVYFSHAGNDYEVDTISSASLMIERDGEIVGNTQLLAEEIQALTGGDLVFVETEIKYSSDDDEVHDEGYREPRKNPRPIISVPELDMDQYDTLFIGYPIWWYDMPMAMYSFLDLYDISGKTIVPFVTHNGSEFGKSVDNMEGYLETDISEDGLAISIVDMPKASELVKDWLSEQGYVSE